MQGAVSLVYLSSSDMYKLINYASFVNWLAIGLSVVALLYFRWKRPNAHRPIKVLRFIGLIGVFAAEILTEVVAAETAVVHKLIVILHSPIGMQ